VTEPGLIGTGLLAPIRLGDGSGRGVGAAEAVAAGEVPAEAAGTGEGKGEALGEALADGTGEGDPPGDGGNDWAGHGPLARTGATDPDPSRTKRASALLSAGPTACFRAVRRPGLGDMPEAGIHSFGPTGPVADHAFV
jgi:hypothetical protein